MGFRLRRIVRACSALISIVSVGCLPYYGIGQKRVPRDPIGFEDANTGQAIGAALVIPRYSSCSGTATEGGHGPGSMKCRVFIAHPFLYREGERFAVRQTKSKGILFLWPDGFVGSGSTLDGVLVMAPGYKSRWVWDLWSRDRIDKRLVPLAASEAREALQDLLSLTEATTLKGPRKEMFSYAANDALYVRLTEDDKTLVRSFVREALTKLP